MIHMPETQLSAYLLQEINHHQKFFLHYFTLQIEHEFIGQSEWLLASSKSG